jgi:hypothetical protein
MLDSRRLSDLNAQTLEGLVAEITRAATSEIRILLEEATTEFRKATVELRREREQLQKLAHKLEGKLATIEREKEPASPLEENGTHLTQACLTYQRYVAWLKDESDWS